MIKATITKQTNNGRTVYIVACGWMLAQTGDPRTAKQLAKHQESIVNQ